MALTHNLKPLISLSSTLFPHSSSSPSPPFLPQRTQIHSLSFITKTHSNLPHPIPILSRRLFLPSVSAIWDALTGGNNNDREAVVAIRRGMLLFRQGDVLGSLSEFDKAIEIDPRQKAYLWQRGLSLYYLDSCVQVGRDPRPVMREAYNMFKDGGDPEQLVAAFSSRQDAEYFYASLYAGLYHESQSKQDSAKFHILAACQSPYGQRADDYMASLAKVHCLCRNWSSS
ncbi:uncharacterized protein LOC110815379 isoform X2 [Carica papaya]|uniref:uncharacterized protein LOC110815379 isoform X2 n=1 Tax=Carica papaya TaxID=3649 RepID=UPI000B8C8DEF|nr:uncharacterized protein LOC110815379 isoform X2 [Carica papaya]